MKTLILAALIAFSTTPAYGAWVSGNQFLDYCTSEGAADQGMCYGYIAGWLGADSIRGLLDEDPTKPFICTEANVTLGQLKDIAIKFFKDNPENRHLGAEIMLFGAFIQHFRCPDFKKE